MHIKEFIRRHPVASYFVMAYAISWVGALMVVAPKILQGQTVQPMDGLLMFPAMLAGPAIAGIALTGVLDGRKGLRDLRSRMGRWRFEGQGFKWYAILLVPPVVITVVLLALSGLVSPVFAPRLFPVGIFFGLIAGFIEEIGWTGYALPRMLPKQGVLGAGITLGVLWGFWHLPVIDSLGAASPHGTYWLPYVLAFVAVMTAIRVIMAWAYSRTTSILLVQLMHACSTGALVMLSPAYVSPAQEVFWYAIYAAALWVGIAMVAVVVRRRARQSSQEQGAVSAWTP
jgi:membrane protease YdiL (CAAX protease family)